MEKLDKVLSFNNTKHHYLPDFIEDGKYIEVKGFWKAEVQAKIDAFPKDKTLVILYSKEMKKYLEYTISTYGKDFTYMYDK